MGSSVRNLTHVIDCYKIGVDAATIPMKVVKEMFNHPLTDSGFLQFKNISTNSFGNLLCINCPF